MENGVAPRLWLQSQFEQCGAHQALNLDQEGLVGFDEAIGKGGAASGVECALVQGAAVGCEDAVGGVGCGALKGDEVGPLAQ